MTSLEKFIEENYDAKELWDETVTPEEFIQNLEQYVNKMFKTYSDIDVDSWDLAIDTVLEYLRGIAV